MLSLAAEDLKSSYVRVQGGSITFPDPVLESGFISFKDTIVAQVDGGQYKIWEKIYRDRLFWNSITGLFTLGELQRNQSGIYKIDSKDRERVSTYHKLTVYGKSTLVKASMLVKPVVYRHVTPDSLLFCCSIHSQWWIQRVSISPYSDFPPFFFPESVSAPQVTKLNVSTESCTLLCEVQRAEETTLHWYGGTDILNQSSSALSLPLTVGDFTSAYRCVAKNPAENKTVDINAMALCSPQRDTHCQAQRCDGKKNF